MGIVRPRWRSTPSPGCSLCPLHSGDHLAVVNLVGLAVNSMQDAHESDVDEQTDDYRKVMARLIKSKRNWTG